MCCCVLCCVSISLDLTYDSSSPLMCLSVKTLLNRCVTDKKLSEVLLVKNGSRFYALTPRGSALQKGREAIRGFINGSFHDGACSGQLAHNAEAATDTPQPTPFEPQSPHTCTHTQAPTHSLSLSHTHTHTTATRTPRLQCDLMFSPQSNSRRAAATRAVQTQRRRSTSGGAVASTWQALLTRGLAGLGASLHAHANNVASLR